MTVGNTKMKNIFIFIFCLVLLSSLVSAHQPRITFDKSLPVENPFSIRNPEVSQAFYGELKGSPDYYLIESEETFDFFLQILSPFIEGAKKDFMVETYYQNNIIAFLNGTETEWTEFYEEFGGDSYWQGPELRTNLSEGSYLIKVYNENNQGKYVLVVGFEESFPFKEIIKTYAALPRLKSGFFGKPSISFLFGIMGLFLFIGVVIVILVVVVLYYVFRRKKAITRSKKRRYRKKWKK
jgi:hypothetical protein